MASLQLSLSLRQTGKNRNLSPEMANLREVVIVSRVVSGHIACHIERVFQVFRVVNRAGKAIWKVVRYTLCTRSIRHCHVVFSILHYKIYWHFGH